MELTKLPTKEEEKELMKKCKSGCRDSQNKLYKKYELFIKKKIRQYWPSKYEFDEGLSCANCEFMPAINYYKPELGFKFATLLETFIKNALKKLKNETNRQFFNELEYIKSTEIEENSSFKKGIVKLPLLIESNDRNIKDYSEILNPKEIKVLEDKAININQNETAKKFGVSQPMIHKLIKTAEKKIKKFACSPIV